MRKITFSLLFGLIFSMAIMTYANESQQNIAESVVRLHVIANSDEKEDQTVKLMVRDGVSEVLSPLLKDAKTSDEAKKIINENIALIQKTAQNILTKNGFSYTAKAFCGKSHFPTKKYENITLPPGIYDALKIVLGNGEGQNWWCVMYPPLCFNSSNLGFAKSKSVDKLKTSLDKNSYALITDSSSSVEFKFKLLELYDEFKTKFN